MRARGGDAARSVHRRDLGADGRHRFMLTSLMFLGELTEVARRVPQLLSVALEQGNMFAATDLRTRLNPIWLATDDPDRARDEVIAAMTQWPREGFHLQHYTSLVALAQIELYTGDFEVAWKHMDQQVKPLERSMLLRTQGLRIECVHLRARLALASAFGREGSQRRLRIADGLAPHSARGHGVVESAREVDSRGAPGNGATRNVRSVDAESVEGFEATDMAFTRPRRAVGWASCSVVMKGGN